MKKWHPILILVLLGGLLQAAPISTRAAAVLDLYGTFESMGVIVNLDASDDPQGNASAEVKYRLSGGSYYQQGFPLSRVTETRFVGSLFWLEPGTTYDVQVTFSDPDGGPLNGTTISSSQSTRAEITIPAPSKSYYVSPTGSGVACTFSSACDLQTAIDQAQAGEAIILRGGVYYMGEISLPNSGVEGAPIVISNYGEEEPILDGSYPTPFSWESLGDSVFRTTVINPNPHLFVADGERLYPYQSLEDLQNLRWGLPGFYANSTELYVRLPDDKSPYQVEKIISRYNHAFHVQGQNYIYFKDLTFRHYGRDQWAKAIYLDNASNNLIQNCTFGINDLGIGIKNQSGRNVIEGNTFYDTIFRWQWDAVKADSGLETGGVRFYAPTSGRGNVIRDNMFYDYFDGFGACPNETAGETNETDVYRNLVFRVGDDGMETDGECSNVRIWDNVFHDVLIGISLAPVYTGPVYAIRNLVYNTGVGNNTYPGSPFKFNSGFDPSGEMFLFHNTSDAALAGNSGLDIKSPGEWKLITTRNNIWSGTDYALENANPTQPLDLDYDDLYTPRAELVHWDGIPTINTIQELRNATGQEPHGINLEPDFIDVSTGSYALAASSQLIDKGVHIPGINDDYEGLAPDIGAFEFKPSLSLQGSGGNGLIYLNWEVNTTLPFTSTWTISYYGTPGDETSPIRDIHQDTHNYILTGLTNHEWYSVTLSTEPPLLSDTISVMPTEMVIYLPAIIR